MTNGELLSAVVEEIKNATTKGESFSAFDITKKLRSKHNAVINHADVKNLVYKLMVLVTDYEIVDNGIYKLYTPSENIDNDHFDDFQSENRTYVLNYSEDNMQKKQDKSTLKNSEPEMTAKEIEEKFWDNLLTNCSTNSSTKKECKKCDEGCDKQNCKKIEKKVNLSEDEKLQKFFTEALEILFGKK